jgi:Fe-S cluster assembly protein SufD
MIMAKEKTKKSDSLTTENNLRYENAFEKFQMQRGDNREPWVQQLRQKAMSRFSELGFPTVRDEEWKYTNVDEIARARFQVTFEDAHSDALKDEIEKLHPCPLAWNRIVFVNGRYAQEFSHVIDLPDNVYVGTLRQAIQSGSSEVKQHLAKKVKTDDNGFTALNTAFIDDGAFIFVPNGQRIDRPLELVFISKSVNGAVLSQPRNLIVLGKSSRATIIETHVSPSNDRYCTNVVTEMVLGEASKLDHLKLQKESRRAYHIALTQVNVMGGATFSSTTVDLGGKLTRNNLNIDLQAEGAECILNGLYFTSGEQHVDNHTLINHSKPHGTSHQLYKGILDDSSTAVFGGKIYVHEDAQKTDAHQVNKNLLLSEKATVDTKPQLEIFADDVKCTHGTAVGQLDEDALFYLKSRGVGEEKARKILSYGFANEVIEKIKVPSIHAQLTELVLERFEHQLKG